MIRSQFKSLVFLLLVTSTSCIKDHNSSTETYLNNQTDHTIEIYPYTNGQVVTEDYKIIGPSERLKVYDDNPPGRTLAPCWGILLRPYDSVIVTFDGEYSVKHNRFSDSAQCEKCILPSNDRNITNQESYKEEVTKNHKKYLVGYYEYIFSEADYEFASQQ